MNAVKIVVHGVPAHHQVADVQLGAQGTGNARIHQMGHAIAVAQNLGAQRRVDLAHAALDDDHAEALQIAFIEGAPSLDPGAFVFQHPQQGLHLLLHSADNAKFCHCVSSCFRFSVMEL